MQTEEGVDLRPVGKAIVFFGVGTLSAVLLWYATCLIRKDDIVLGGEMSIASALFWYPLFRLGTTPGSVARPTVDVSAPQ